MICPFANYIGVGNHAGPMSGHIGLVCHVQEGNNSLAGWFNNPASGVSAHFWCSKTGVLEQYLDTNLTAWAQAAGNSQYLSVETEGFDTEALTDAQVAMVARLLSWCAQGYGFPIVGPVPHGSPGFTPHCNPDGTPDPAWGNHSCPGSIRLAQMPAVVAAAGPVPIPPLPDIKEESMDSVFGPDGNLYVSAASAGTASSAEDNLLVFQIKPGNPPTVLNVIDFTSDIAGKYGSTYRVAP